MHLHQFAIRVILTIQLTITSASTCDHPGFSGVRGIHFFKDLYGGFFSFIYLFFCPRHVSCVPNVVSSIFSITLFFYTHSLNNEIVDFFFLNIYLIRSKESFPAMENQKSKELSWKHVILILLFARVTMLSIQYVRHTMTSLFYA